MESVNVQKINRFFGKILGSLIEVGTDVAGEILVTVCKAIAGIAKYPLFVFTSMAVANPVINCNTFATDSQTVDGLASGQKTRARYERPVRRIAEV